MISWQNQNNILIIIIGLEKLVEQKKGKQKFGNKSFGGKKSGQQKSALEQKVLLTIQETKGSQGNACPSEWGENCPGTNI